VDFVLVTVQCRNGLVGRSYALDFDYGPELLRAVIENRLSRYYVGESALDVRTRYGTAWAMIEYIGQAGIALCALAAIDIALWDLLGKAASLPLYRLLGARVHEAPAYASGGWLSYSMDQLADEVARFRAQGFKAVKIKVGGPEMRTDVERVRLVREVLGPDIDLMIDANQAYTAKQAEAFYRQVAEYGITWFEEPISHNDHQGYTYLSHVLPVPLAMGEREYGLVPFRELLRNGAIQVMQPDALRLGGITAMLQAARLAEIYEIPLAPHFYKEIDIHVVCSSATGRACEGFEWIHPLLREPLQLVDGKLQAPQRPGLGLEWDENVVREYEVRG
jgi:L-alanine-DL-glutamate epimerase-like enolase superfamily enzyme